VHLLVMAASAIALDFSLAARHIPAFIADTYEQGRWLQFARQMALLVLIGGYPVACIYCAFMYKRIARWLLLIYYGLWAFVMIAVLVQHKSAKPGFYVAGAILTALCLAGMGYFWTSKRVKNTFTH